MAGRMYLNESKRAETVAGTWCRSCGSYVTESFARVFGNNDNEIYACIECSSARDLYHGRGTDPDA
jgi:hypothetical protein